VTKNLNIEKSLPTYDYNVTFFLWITFSNFLYNQTETPPIAVITPPRIIDGRSISQMKKEDKMFSNPSSKLSQF
jgi:hypothetical protein